MSSCTVPKPVTPNIHDSPHKEKELRRENVRRLFECISLWNHCIGTLSRDQMSTNLIKIWTANILGQGATWLLSQLPNSAFVAGKHSQATLTLLGGAVSREILTHRCQLSKCGLPGSHSSDCCFKQSVPCKLIWICRKHYLTPPFPFCSKFLSARWDIHTHTHIRNQRAATGGPQTVNCRSRRILAGPLEQSLWSL